MRIIFDKIYLNKHWSFAGDGSGIGSCPSYNKNMRNALTRFVIEHNITTFLDVPCGSCKWSSIWLEELENEYNYKLYSYFGIDVSSEAIVKSYKNLNKSYAHITHGDFTTCNLPMDYDLLFCRDALQHLSYYDIWQSLCNFAKCHAKWYVLGGYWPGQNKDIETGNYFAINLTRPPFNLVPDKIMSEDNDPNHPQKHFFIFSRESFLVQIQDNFFSI